jgi:hypothetical protein
MVEYPHVTDHNILSPVDNLVRVGYHRKTDSVEYTLEIPENHWPGDLTPLI